MNRISLIFLAWCFSILPACSAEDPWTQKRDVMVDEQIVARGVSDPQVIAAMRRVPRHEFVALNMRPYAYEDRPLPIDFEQTISQPFIVAYMTEAVRPTGEDRVLEIGTGSGYQAAILAEIVRDVYSIEIVEGLARQAEQRLKEMGYKNIVIKHGDGYQGWEEHAPFDVIIVTAAPPEVPQPLVDQLAEGGRLIAPVGSFYQELIMITKKDGLIHRERLIPVRFVPMIKGESIGTSTSVP